MPFARDHAGRPVGALLQSPSILRVLSTGENTTRRRIRAGSQSTNKLDPWPESVMPDEPTFDERARLYSLLIDQLQRYNSIVWQVPTALMAADVIALQQLQDRPIAMLGVSQVSLVLSFAYYRMVRQQGAIIQATQQAETSLRETHNAFIPQFSQSVVSARWLIVLGLTVFNIGLVVHALRGLAVPVPPPMNMGSLSFWFTVIGYSVAVLGSVLLFLGTPQDVGLGKMPRVSGAKAGKFFDEQERAIARRNSQTRVGFAFLLVGMALQLAGFLTGFR